MGSGGDKIDKYKVILYTCEIKSDRMEWVVSVKSFWKIGKRGMVL